MGKIDKELAISMRRDGKSYSEIADCFGVSCQAVQYCLKRCIKARKDMSAIEKIPYKGLYEFMVAHPKVSITSLSAKIVKYPDHANAEKVRRFIQGKNAQFPKYTYDRLLAYTGMTYERLFELRDGFKEDGE